MACCFRASQAEAGQGKAPVGAAAAALPDTLIQASLEAELKALVASKGCGPILIRLSWHDAGVYSNGAGLKGGCPNAAMRFTDGEGSEGLAERGFGTTKLPCAHCVGNSCADHF